MPEAYLTNAHIPLYKFAGDRPSYEPLRPRKLLLKKKEIRYLMGKKDEQGLTLVPIKIYTKHSFIKLEFGVGKGRKKYDKREVIKKRELDRQIRALEKGRKNIKFSMMSYKLIILKLKIVCPPVPIGTIRAGKLRIEH